MDESARRERARLLGLRNRKHGQAGIASRGPTYRSWECMRARCHNEKDPSFAHYGGRGIAVHPRWDDFTLFLADMGERPRGTSLDRINVDGDYEPGNCRWAESREQARNKRSNRMVEYGGAVRTLVEVSEMSGVPYQRLHERIVRRGWSVEKAVSTPPRGHR